MPVCFAKMITVKSKKKSSKLLSLVVLLSVCSSSVLWGYLASSIPASSLALTMNKTHEAEAVKHSSTFFISPILASLHPPETGVRWGCCCTGWAASHLPLVGDPPVQGKPLQQRGWVFPSLHSLSCTRQELGRGKLPFSIKVVFTRQKNNLLLCSCSLKMFLGFQDSEHKLGLREGLDIRPLQPKAFSDSMIAFLSGFSSWRPCPCVFYFWFLT